MCHCMLCDCFYWNCCGAGCVGIHYALCLASCWLCKPAMLQVTDPNCCHCCEFVGYGGQFCCYGYHCCSPANIKALYASIEGLKNAAGQMMAGMGAAMQGR